MMEPYDRSVSRAKGLDVLIPKRIYITIVSTKLDHASDPSVHLCVIVVQRGWKLEAFDLQR